MKKILVILLIVTMFSICACKNSEPEQNKENITSDGENIDPNKDPVITKTLTIHYNNGMEDVIKELPVGTNIKSALNEVTYEGYEFLGWFTDEALRKELGDSDELTRSCHVFASWKKIIIIDPNADEFDKENNDVSLKDNATREMTNPFYWLNKLEDVDTVLKTKEEIDKINEETYKNSENTGLIDITKINEITEAQVYSLVNKMQNAAPAKSDNTNLSGLNSTSKNNIEIKYAVCVKNTSIKNVPVTLRTGTNNKYQETGFETGEGVLVYYESKDGLWYFVQGGNYAGWTLKENIALCSKEDFDKFVSPSDFIVVTCERFKKDDLIPNEVRMGAILPLKGIEGDQYTILFPINNDGALEIKEITLTLEHENFSHGYLPFTIKSLIKQMYKMLGEPYDWGDEYGGRDCSSTVDAAYKCFGFKMPRNTSQIKNLVGTNYNVGSKTVNEKKEIMNGLTPGSIILKSGHVMMYLGIDNGYHYIIHNISGGVTISRCDKNSYSYSEYNTFIDFLK